MTQKSPYNNRTALISPVGMDMCSQNLAVDGHDVKTSQSDKPISEEERATPESDEMRRSRSKDYVGRDGKKMRFLGASFASVLGATLFILVILRMQIDGCPSVKLPCDRVAHPLFDWSANACRCVQVITAFKISRGLGRGSFFSLYYLCVYCLLVHT